MFFVVSFVSSNSSSLPHFQIFVNNFFILFLKLFCFKMSVFKQLAYFIKVSSDYQVLFYFFWNISVSHIQPPICISTERRGWDSNPRALADKRFSRPPRYDHFDTSPYVFLAFCFVLFISDVDKYITTHPLCQHFFLFFLFILKFLLKPAYLLGL